MQKVIIISQGVCPYLRDKQTQRQNAKLRPRFAHQLDSAERRKDSNMFSYL